jgi:D-alanyl-D-alanine endopeptidase (penicillin-binding protein 7)
MYAVTTTIPTDYIGPQFTTQIDSYLVAKIENGIPIIVAGKNADVSRPLASLTKVMTGYQLMNDGVAMDALVEYNPAIHRAPSGYLYKIAPGDIIQNKDLFHALLVSSFNTPALMLVDSLGKTKAEFVQEMNETAQKWGLTKTYFVDPHGYTTTNQSTAREYLTVFLKAMDNPILQSYLSEPTYSYTEVVNAGGVALHSDINSNRLFFSADEPYTIHGSKTGFLNEAGYNLAMLIERTRDNAQFVIITLGNPNYSQKYSETNRLTHWALATF